MRSWMLLLLLLPCVSQLASGKVQVMPHFNYTHTPKLLLNWDDVWEVGDTGTLAVLRAGTRISVWLRVAGDTGVGLRRMLSFRCPGASGPADTIDLDLVGSATGAVTRCLDSLPFVLAKADDADIDKFRLSIGKSRLPRHEVFSKALELLVRVEFSTGRLASKPLRVWSLDPIGGPPASSGADYHRGFLTERAVSFGTRMDSSVDSFDSIEFLDPEIVKAFQEAPELFKAKLNLGMILYFDSSSCITYQLSNSILLTNYHSKMDSEHKNLGKLFYLNLKDGRLWFSTCGLSREVKNFFDKRRPEYSIGICTITSFTGDAEPYVSTGPVRLRVPLTEVAYGGCSSTGNSRKCDVVPGVDARIAVLTGMDNTAVVCPITCTDKSEVYRFFRDDKPLIGNSLEEWSLVNGIRVSRTGNVIEFPPTVSSSHSGTYRCEAGSKKFTFYINVTSLPHFCIASSTVGRDASGATDSGLLPEKVYAMEGESLSYSCTATFASLTSVTVTPMFYIATYIDGKMSWQSLNEEAFRQKVDITAKFLNLTTSSTSASKTLTVTVSRVPGANPSMNANFSHRFECSASVDPVESRLVGMDEYKVQSPGSEVLFVPRLTLDSFVLNPRNNCSVQKCLMGKGALFEFRLAEATANYLRDAGVEVTAFFRLDNVLLTDASVLFRDGASELMVDNARGSLTYRVLPVSSSEVMRELIDRRSLTPVFNLRYRAGTQLGSLVMHKGGYGKPPAAVERLDCRTDPLCFYSTDFDVDEDLSFLPIALEFERPPAALPLVAGASAQIAAIVIAALFLLAGLVVIVYLATRKSGNTYPVAEMELQQGYNPLEEARAEVFGEYQRPSYLEGVWEPTQGREQLSLISGLSGDVGDDRTNIDDIDYREFGEEGSFIGNYQTDPRQRDTLMRAAPMDDDMHL